MNEPDPLYEALMSRDDVPITLAELGWRRPAWMRRGACVGKDATLWFADERGPSRDAARAASWCAGCPVVDDCLSYALADSSLVGVWGGLTTAERARMRRKGAA